MGLIKILTRILMIIKTLIRIILTNDTFSSYKKEDIIDYKGYTYYIYRI